MYPIPDRRGAVRDTDLSNYEITGGEEKKVREHSETRRYSRLHDCKGGGKVMMPRPYCDNKKRSYIRSRRARHIRSQPHSVGSPYTVLLLPATNQFPRSFDYEGIEPSVRMMKACVCLPVTMIHSIAG